MVPHFRGKKVAMIKCHLFSIISLNKKQKKTNFQILVMSRTVEIFEILRRCIIKLQIAQICHNLNNSVSLVFVFRLTDCF